MLKLVIWGRVRVADEASTIVPDLLLDELEPDELELEPPPELLEPLDEDPDFVDDPPLDDEPDLLFDEPPFDELLLLLLLLVSVVCELEPEPDPEPDCPVPLVPLVPVPLAPPVRDPELFCPALPPPTMPINASTWHRTVTLLALSTVPVSVTSATKSPRSIVTVARASGLLSQGRAAIGPRA